MNKTKKVIRIILQVLVSLSFLAAGFAKLSKNAQEVTLFHTVGLDSVLMIIGLLELLVVVLLWIKKTRSFAILLASAILGAAFAETITASVPKEVVAPGITLLIFWIIWLLDCRCHCNCGACKDCQVKEEKKVQTKESTM